jgi:L-ascorbate 6-phosphate lactonase
MNTTLRWIGQGGFILEAGGRRLVIDPYLSDSVFKSEGLARLVPPACAPEELKADLVICTHDHLDHLDEETLKCLDAATTVFCGPSSCTTHFKSMGIPPARIRSLDRGASLDWSGARIDAVFAAHTPDSIGVAVTLDSSSIYFSGDSQYDPRLAGAAAGRKIDILVCCINGRLGNMNCAEAAALAKELKAKTAVPCHYGMFKENTEDPQKFKQALAGTNVQYRELIYNQAYLIMELLA